MFVVEIIFQMVNCWWGKKGEIRWNIDMPIPSNNFYIHWQYTISCRSRMREKVQKQIITSVRIRAGKQSLFGMKLEDRHPNIMLTYEYDLWFVWWDPFICQSYEIYALALSEIIVQKFDYFMEILMEICHDSLV